MSNTSATRFLQQENLRLQKENESLQQRNQALLRRLERIKELYWAGQQITSEKNMLEALNELLHDTMQIIDAEDGSLSYLDERAGELVFVLALGHIGQQLQGFRIKKDVGIVGWVVANYEPVIVNHPRQDWRFSVAVDERFGFSTRSIVSVPVMDRQRLVGVIQLLNKRQGEFDEADVALLLILGQIATIVLRELS
jgi:phosphoserine phosphatase RsbU/P